MRKNIPIDEKKTLYYDIPALVAIHMLGGSAHIDDIHVKVSELVAKELSESDHCLMCQTDHGEDYAPDGYQGGTWEVWNGKLSTALGAHLTKQGLVTRKNNVFTLTSAGMSRLGCSYAHMAWDYPLK